MQYSACLNPQRIYNKYVGKYVTVPCGRCDACIISRSMPSVERLNIEREKWYDCIFFTLTYADEHIPRLEKCGNLFVHNLDLDNKLGSNKFVYASDFKCDENFINYYMKELGFIPILSRSDIRNYVLQLKKVFKNEFKICICTEYGPSSFRAHAHGLLFFNKRDAIKEIETDSAALMLRSCWSTVLRGATENVQFLGNVDTQYVESGANSYVAQYLHCTTHLPAILRQFPPFKQESRYIGHDVVSPQQVRESFFRADGLVSKPTSAKSTDVEYSLMPKYIYLRYFPKFRGYNRITSTTFCSLVVYTLSFNTAEEFRNNYRYTVRTYIFEPIWPIDWEILQIFNFDEYVTDSQLDSFFYALRKMHRISRLFHVSLQFYIDRYLQFYSSIELLKLKQFYELQTEIADNPLVESEFINGLYDEFEVDAPPYPCPIDRLNHFRTLRNCPLFKQFETKMKKILGDTTKTKHANECKNSKRARDLNNILMNY